MGKKRIGTQGMRPKALSSSASSRHRLILSATFNKGPRVRKNRGLGSNEFKALFSFGEPSALFTNSRPILVIPIRSGFDLIAPTHVPLVVKIRQKSPPGSARFPGLAACYLAPTAYAAEHPVVAAPS